MGIIYTGGIVVTSGGGGGGGGTPANIPTPPNDSRFFLGNDGTGSLEWSQVAQTDLETTFTVSLSVASGGSSTIEVGSTWTPTFNRSFSLSDNITAESITDSLGGSASRLGSANPIQAPASSYTRTTVNAQVTIRDSATRSGTTAQSNPITMNWGCPIWTGVKAIPGAYNAAFVATLTKGSPVLTRVGSYSYTSDAESGKRAYFVVSQTHAALTTTLVATKFQIDGGLLGGFTQVATGVSMTLGTATVLVDIWESNQDFTATGSPHSVAVT